MSAPQLKRRESDARPTFGEGVEPRHERIDVEEWEEIYVVGDVHGCRAEFEQLLDRLDLRDDELVVLVGDLVRKGPDSAGVLELVKERENVKSVLGNNEDKLVRGDKDIGLSEKLSEFVHSLPLVISWEGAMVVHGGIDPKQEYADHDPQELLNMRAPYAEGSSYDGPFWYDDFQGPQRVFFGHTVHEAPMERDHAVALDTGCVYGGQLTAYDYFGDDVITVPAFETYQGRSDDKIVDTESDHSPAF
ncbi:metallophosphoesterase [Halorussus halophilus]|uniref:metallophosphoesterase n=1 Tax=Halorussus halophilus TaxID=2650975 RepID=UPI001300D2AA|nr:metallophosphoesterase [Halorussus halophilus]